MFNCNSNYALTRGKKFVDDRSKFFLIKEDITKKELEVILKDDASLKYLFVNPNAQGFYIDKNLLGKINIKGINTCSTGTNHIDLDYCKKKIYKLSL